MASHYRFYPSAENVVYPFNATFEFPSESNKAIKISPRIEPKTTGPYVAGNVIRIEFPAQGYVNPANTTLSFEAVLKVPTFDDGGANLYPCATRFQNNIQSIFSRVRLMYGSTPIEDIIDYGVLARQLTEWTASNNAVVDQTSVSEGIGSALVRTLGNGILQSKAAAVQTKVSSNAQTVDGRQAVVEKYMIQLLLGLFTQKKLIPTKWMASQLAIEITLANDVDVIYHGNYGGLTSTQSVSLQPTYQVRNVVLLPEILEFNETYDNMFLEALRGGGVPIKMNGWHTFISGQGKSSIGNYTIQERARSVKSIFTIIRRSINTFKGDSGATFSNLQDSAHMLQFQYRIGGRYFPASPVVVNSAQYRSSGSEAFAELQKCLATLGDYRLSNSVNRQRWNMPYINLPAVFADENPVSFGSLVIRSSVENDGDASIFNIASDNGFGDTGGSFGAVRWDPDPANLPSLGGTFGEQSTYGSGAGVFCMATNLETSSGAEISGLNAMEQSDIMLMANWAAATSGDYVVETFVLFDKMLILLENNAIKVIE